MKIWPSEKEKLQRLTIFLFLIALAGLVLISLLLIRTRNLAQSPPCTTVSSLQPGRHTPPCLQRVDESGWEIQNSQIRTFPRCLTVMNSRFGSRFNLDWFASDQKTTSSLLGNQEDQNSFLQLYLEDNQIIEPVFPISKNSAFPDYSIDLGLTYQQANFENKDLLVAFKITAPFSPSQSPEDINTKISTAPFFYFDLSLTNKTNLSQKKTVFLTIGRAEKTASDDNFDLIYFHDPTRLDGHRALASQDLSDLKPYFQSGQGGFSWQADLLPFATQKIRLVYAGFLDGPVITDHRRPGAIKKLGFAYHRWFENVDEVVEFAFNQENEIRHLTSAFEKKLTQAKLSPQAKWLLAQAFHSYLGNTWLVMEKNNPDRLFYFVWEGEFKYLNTLDVAHDYAVLEGLYFPWVLKLELESWRESAKKDDWGTVIPHDLGVRFRFNGSQAYGIPGFQTSGMPVEENANFILLAHWYWHQTSDNQYLEKLTPFIKELFDSLAKRDTNQNGLADQGLGITTYDNDGNLALLKAPDSTYLGVKQLAAYLAAGKIFQSFGQKDWPKFTNQQAEKIASSLKKIDEERGYIPLTLNPTFKEKRLFNGQTISGNREQGLAFVTGLFYPALTGLKSPILDKLTPILTKSYSQAYQKSLVLNQEGQTIGLQLTQYQGLGLGWLSHSAMADFINQKLFNSDSKEPLEIYFPLLFDNPGSYSDGQFFKQPWYPPQTTLIFYPRGGALFCFLAS